MKALQVLPSRAATAVGQSRTKLAPSYRFDHLAGVLLATAAIPLVLAAGVKLSITLPLCVLLGLTCQSFFRLILNPTDCDLFHPSTLVAGYFFVYFGLRSLYLTAIPFSERLGRAPYDDNLPIALWCACLGFLCFTAGNQSGLASKLLPARSLSWPRAVPAVRIAMLLGLGLLGLIYLLKMGYVVGNFTNRSFQRNPPPGLPILLATLPSLSWVAICVCLSLSRRAAHSGQLWVLGGICLTILSGNLAMSGGKEAAIQPLLETLVVVHYLRRRFKIWEMIAIAIPTLLLTFGVINFYRFVVVGQSGAPKNVSDVISRVSSVSDLFTSSRRISSDPSAFEQMMQRDAGIDALALVMKYTPHPFHYQYGRSLLQFPLTFIPRPLWRDKPIDLQSVQFESKYMAEPEDFNGFSSIHLISDFYRNFGVMGVATGMFLFGAGLRFIYVFCSPSRSNGAGVFLYAAVLPQLIHLLEMDMGSLLISTSRLILLLFAVAGFLHITYRKVDRERGVRMFALNPASLME